MEKAVLKTIIYSDIFDYPLKINEIHKWLVGKKVTLRQVEKMLIRLNKESGIKNYGQYYFLRKRDRLAAKRRHREKQSKTYFRKAKILSQVLKLIPWIKLVGVSGGLAMGNADWKDDIDLFIVTSKNRLWISRLLTLGLLSLTGQRRKKVDSGKRIAGKLCVNILLEEDKLEQKNKDIFVAHEVLQMRPLWYRAGIYSKFLEDNSWAFKFLPNWITESVTSSKYLVSRENIFFNVFEKYAKWLQLRIMQKPQGMERIEEGAVYFHPGDCRLKVLSEYKAKIKKSLTIP